MLGFGVKGRAAIETLLAHGTPRERDRRDRRGRRRDRGGQARGLRGRASATPARRTVLEAAGVRDAAAVIVAPDRDDSAVLITLTARELNPGARIVASVREEENAHLLRQGGADSVVVSSGAAGRLLGHAIKSPRSSRCWRTCSRSATGSTSPSARSATRRPASGSAASRPTRRSSPSCAGPDVLRFDDARDRRAAARRPAGLPLHQRLAQRIRTCMWSSWWTSCITTPRGPCSPSPGPTNTSVAPAATNAVDELLREPPVDQAGRPGAALEPVDARVVDVGVEPVLVRRVPEPAEVRRRSRRRGGATGRRSRPAARPGSRRGTRRAREQVRIEPVGAPAPPAAVGRALAGPSRRSSSRAPRRAAGRRRAARPAHGLPTRARLAPGDRRVDRRDDLGDRVDLGRGRRAGRRASAAASRTSTRRRTPPVLTRPLSATLPARRALLRERPHALEEVVRARSTPRAARPARASTAGSSAPSAASSSRITRLLPAQRQRRVGGDLRRELDARGAASSSAAGTTSLTRPQRSASPALDVRAVKNSSRVRGGADRVDELAQPRVGVDEPEPRRRHPELRVLGRQTRRSHESASSSPPPIAWPLSAASDRVRERVDRLDRVVNGCATIASAAWANSSCGSAPMS